MFPKRLRILFYAVNGLGLGHLTRLLSLCQHLKEAYTELDCLFITSSDADNLLSQYQIPYVHLPSKTVLSQSEDLTSRKLGRIYSSVVNGVYDTFQPHVLIVDTMPTGSFHDLLSILRFGNCFKIFVHRARKLEAYSQATIQAQRFYDLVIAPHFKDEEVIPAPIGHEIPLYWSGPLMLVNKEQALPREQVRALWQVAPEDQLLMLSLGGGGDTTNLATLHNVLPFLKKYPQLKILLAGGLLPQQRANFQELLQVTPELIQKIIIKNEFPMARYLNGVDLALATAGYNTFHELLYFGVPTLFIPKVRGYDDQLGRARKAEKEGACLVCEEDESFQSNFCNTFEILLQKKAQLSAQALQYVPDNFCKPTAQVILEQVSLKLFENHETPPSASERVSF